MVCTRSLSAGVAVAVALLFGAATAAAGGFALPDAKAAVGRLFKYRLLLEKEDGSHIQITEANQESLPPWLYYSAKSGTLKGVPRPADRGVYIIAVKGLPGSLSPDGDIFALSVVDDASAEVASQLGERRDTAQSCRPREPVTTAGVVIDVDLSSLDARQLVHLLTSLAVGIGVQERHVSLLSMSDRALGWLPDAADKSVLVAGPGNIAVPRAGVPGAVAAWVVGCGVVSENHVFLLEELERSALGGELALTIGQDVVGWRVANRLPAAAASGKHRFGRQAAATDMPERVMATGVPGPQPSASSSAVTGDLSRSAPAMTSASAYPQVSVTSVPPTIRPTTVVSTVATVVPAQATTRLPPTTVEQSTTRTPPPAVTTPTTVTTTTATTTLKTTPTPTTTTSSTTTSSTTTASTTTASTTTATTAKTQPSTAAVTTRAAVTDPSTSQTTQRTSPITTATIRSSSASPKVSLPSPTTPTTRVFPPTTAISLSVSSAAKTPTSVSSALPVKTAPITVRPSSAPRSTTTQPVLRTSRPALTALRPQLTVAAQTGKLVKYRLPDDTFSEPFYELTLGMTLMNGNPLPRGYWVAFEPDAERVLVLANEQHLGTKEFLVGAINAARAVAQVKVIVNVTQPQPGPDPAAGAAQIYRLTIDANYDELMRNITAYQGLVAALNRLHAGKRVVITSVTRGSVVVSYALLPDEGDDSEPQTVDNGQCDDTSARMDNMRMFNPDGSLRSDVRSSLPFNIVSLTSTPRGACVGRLVPVGFTVTQRATTVTQRATTEKSTPQLPSANKPPVAKEQSLTLVVELGKEVRYELPDDLFLDEDGGTRSLKLRLQSIDATNYPTDTTGAAPLQLRQAQSNKKSMLQALVWEKPNAAASQFFQLLAADRHDAATPIRVYLNVTDATLTPFIFRATLNVDYSVFANNVNKQLELLNRLASFYGDADTSRVSLKAIRPGAAATKTVLVSWTNTSVVARGNPPSCPKDAIAKLSEHVMRNEKLAMPFVDRMKPIPVIGVELEPRGVCSNVLKPVAASVPQVADTDKSREAADSDSFWLTVVVPVIVIIVLLVVAIIVAAVLISRRRRNARANVSGSGANGTFIGKTVPVIFDEEREDGGASCRQPLVQCEDKPVPPPPEYPHLYGDTAYPEQKQPLMSSAGQPDEAQNDVMPPYQPPTPPVSEPDETSTFLRSGAGAAASSRSQQQNLVLP